MDIGRGEHQAIPNPQIPNPKLINPEGLQFESIFQQSEMCKNKNPCNARSGAGHAPGRLDDRHGNPC